jgi:hypothetical protein
MIGDSSDSMQPLAAFQKVYDLVMERTGARVPSIERYLATAGRGRRSAITSP